jgi:hypothetical protein
MRRVMMMSWGLLLPVLAAGVMSCGSSPYTLGSACNQLGAAYCSRGVECGAFDSVPACKTEFYAGCCADDGACGDEYGADEAAVKQGVRECAASFDIYTCSELAGYGGVPPECLDYYYSAQSSKLSAPALKAEQVARPATLTDAKPLSQQSEAYKVAQRHRRILPRPSGDSLAQ